MYPKYHFPIFTLVLIYLTTVFGDPRGSRVRRIVGGLPAEMPPYDDPIVYTRFAGHSAKVRGIQDYPHFVFRGIRYAHPPTGKDRFQRPRQFYLSGDIDATKFPSPCTQPIANTNKVIGSEDCLFLNVFTPDLPLGAEGLPVIVWIHGGGFRYGSASQYGVQHLVGKQLVIVTIQYRLGSLGFLGTGTQQMPGNAALWDMVLGVQWVRNHIGFFGGNPYKIVVMGHGTGASSALIMALNNVAKGYTQGVIALSGTAVSHWAVESDPDITAKQVAELQGCPTVAILSMLKCLQSVSAASIVMGDSQVELERLRQRGFVSGLQGRLGSMPNTEFVFDGRSLPPMIDGKPLDNMYYKKTPKIPLLTGTTRDETKRAIHDNYENEIISKLKTVPHFLDEILVKNLQLFTGLGKQSKSYSEEVPASGLFNTLDPFKFRNYLTITKNNLQEGLGKISEMTVDALFNLPAFLTADLWTKAGGTAYLYRFEHAGKSTKARYFLEGLPIIGNSTSNEGSMNDTVGHGDDLAYLFEARALDGSSIEGMDDDFTDEDRKVRDIFTNMISTFARHGQVNVDNQNLPSFSSENNNYVQITSKPKVKSNFRLCEMALWSGLTQQLQSSTCKFLNVLDSQVKNVEFLLFDTVSSVGTNLQNPLKNITGTLGGGIKDTQDQLTGIVQNPLGVLNLGGNKPQKPSRPHLGILGL